MRLEFIQLDCIRVHTTTATIDRYYNRNLIGNQCAMYVIMKACMYIYRDCVVYNIYNHIFTCTGFSPAPPALYNTTR